MNKHVVVPELSSLRPEVERICVGVVLRLRLLTLRIHTLLIEVLEALLVVLLHRTRGLLGLVTLGHVAVRHRLVVLSEEIVDLKGVVDVLVGYVLLIMSMLSHPIAVAHAIVGGPVLCATVIA